ADAHARVAVVGLDAVAAVLTLATEVATAVDAGLVLVEQAVVAGRGGRVAVAVAGRVAVTVAGRVTVAVAVAIAVAVTGRIVAIIGRVVPITVGGESAEAGIERAL